MRTRLDLMSQCVDAFSRAVTAGGCRGHFVSLGDGRLELRIPLDNQSPRLDAEDFIRTVSAGLWRLHRIDIDRYELPASGEQLVFTVTAADGTVDRLPLSFTCLCSELSQMAPVLSVIIGGL